MSQLLNTSVKWLSVVAALLLLSSCGKPTTKSETNRFASAAKETKSLAAIYPGFESLLKKRIEKADVVMKEVQGLKDEQAKIEKMSEARKVLNSGFVSKLSDVDDNLKDLRKDANEVVSEAQSEADRLLAKNASEDAQRVLKNADELLKKGAADEVAAEAILKRLLEDIETSQQNIEKIVDKFQEAKAKAAKAAKVPDVKPGAKPAEDLKGKTLPGALWKCKYCTNSNKSDVTKCKSCGASR